MKNNETGEFELVLGNRQLLSGFFVVVILFAVFFVMGYIVGRNSTPSQAAANRDLQSGGAPAGGRPQAATGSVATNPAAAVETAKEKEDAGAPPAQPPETKTPPAQAAAAEPAPGESYLQVTAVKADLAETVAKTLKDKGFPALLSPGPSGMTRVLVGPYADLSKLGQAKADLERLGFNPFRQKIER
ncbi:MAG TPA: SPOR domain-containing protein [Bryobacteraceae bacterium]|nr:SPOR domain-containing protein [Bryobacteraceae bacterium]